MDRAPPETATSASTKSVDASDKVKVKVALSPAFKVALSLLIAIVGGVVSGATSLSVIVAVPVTAVLLVTVPVMVPVERVKFSDDSGLASSVMAKRSCTEVWPAAMVTAPETVLQDVPPFVETSNVSVAAVSVPSVAVPLLRLGVKLTGAVEA